MSSVSHTSIVYADVESDFHSTKVITSQLFLPMQSFLITYSFWHCVFKSTAMTWTFRGCVISIFFKVLGMKAGERDSRTTWTLSSLATTFDPLVCDCDCALPSMYFQNYFCGGHLGESLWECWDAVCMTLELTLLGSVPFKNCVCCTFVSEQSIITLFLQRKMKLQNMKQ